MSLLLDALKRAEQEKAARQGQDAPADAPAGDAGAAPTPRRTLELEHVESPAAPSPAPAAAASAAKADRAGAKAVFAAKQHAEPAPASGGGSNKAVLAIVVVAVLALLGGGAYVWMEINGTPSPVAKAAPPRPVNPAPIQSLPPAGQPAAAAPVAGSPAAPEASKAAPEAPKAEAPTPAKSDAVPPVAQLKPEKTPAPAPKAKPRPKEAEQLVMGLLRDSAKAKPAPLKLDRTMDTPRVPKDILDGYQALRSGDAAAARTAYEKAVRADPTSLDGHLGLATAAARQGERALATRHYRRALELDPKNPSAVAGLAALADFSRPEAVETQIRADLTRNPQSPALHFTLGNLYAAQQRWNEAQAAYFEAYRLDPESADLAYNLAVSLDQLGQSRLARDFYQRALAAAERQGAQFDPSQVARRIAELKP